MSSAKKCFDQNKQHINLFPNSRQYFLELFCCFSTFGTFIEFKCEKKGVKRRVRRHLTFAGNFIAQSVRIDRKKRHKTCKLCRKEQRFSQPTFELVEGNFLCFLPQPPPLAILKILLSPIIVSRKRDFIQTERIFFFLLCQSDFIKTNNVL